ncbi:MAG: hypothetical protein IMZ53_02215 [Thermoplasmata archaeon]|nr:hypothetical protein [Thermoplasmata archaeon]
MKFNFKANRWKFSTLILVATLVSVCFIVLYNPPVTASNERYTLNVSLVGPAKLGVGEVGVYAVFVNNSLSGNLEYNWNVNPTDGKVELTPNGAGCTLTFLEATEEAYTLIVNVVDLVSGARGYGDKIVFDPYAQSGMYLGVSQAGYDYKVMADGSGWFQVVNGSNGQIISALSSIDSAISIQGALALGSSVLVASGSYPSNIVVPDGTMLTLLKGVTDLTYSVAPGASCFIVDYNSRKMISYVAGVLNSQIDFTSGALTGFTTATGPQFYPQAAYTVYVNGSNFNLVNATDGQEIALYTSSNPNVTVNGALNLGGILKLSAGSYSGLFAAVPNNAYLVADPSVTGVKYASIGNNSRIDEPNFNEAFGGYIGGTYTVVANQSGAATTATRYLAFKPDNSIYYFSTNASYTILSAWNYAKNSAVGGVIQLAAGEFPITTPLVLTISTGNMYTELWGSGQFGATHINGSTLSDYAIQVDATGGFAAQRQKFFNFRLSGGMELIDGGNYFIDSMRFSASGTGRVLLKMVDTSDCKVTNSIFNDGDAGGILLLSENALINDVVIDRCVVDYCNNFLVNVSGNWATDDYARDITISNSWIEAIAGRNCTALVLSFVRSSAITGTAIVGQTGTAYDLINIDNDTRYITFSACRIWSYSGVENRYAVYHGIASYINYVGCEDIYGEEVGLYFSADSHNCIMTACTISSATTGIEIARDSGNFTVRDCTIGGRDSLGTTGILFKGSDLIVDGGVIWKWTVGVQIGASDNYAAYRWQIDTEFASGNILDFFVTNGASRNGILGPLSDATIHTYTNQRRTLDAVFDVMRQWFYPQSWTNITVGGSTYDWQNIYDSRADVFVQGGTVSSLIYSDTSGVIQTNYGMVTGVFSLMPGEHIYVTYTDAPTMKYRFT